jgi:plastocyanin
MWSSALSASPPKIRKRFIVKLNKKIAAVLAVATLPLLAPVAAQAQAPHARVVELRDACQKASWDVEFPGLCSKDAGSVSLPEFRAQLAKGGSGAWWIRQRALTLDAGDTVAATDVGGILHTFTEVDQFGKGCVPEWNQAVSEAVDNCDFGKFGATVLLTGQTSKPQTLSVGVHKFQCLVHPWMRTTITVKA